MCIFSVILLVMTDASKNEQTPIVADDETTQSSNSVYDKTYTKSLSNDSLPYENLSS